MFFFIKKIFFPLQNCIRGFNVKLNKLFEMNFFKNEAIHITGFQRYNALTRIEKCRICFERKPNIHKRNGSCKACRV